MHHIDPNRCIDEVCDGVQIHLHNYFLNQSSSGLLTNWNSTNKSTSPLKNNTATVTQPSQNSASKDGNNKNKKRPHPGNK